MSKCTLYKLCLNRHKVAVNNKIGERKIFETDVIKTLIAIQCGIIAEVLEMSAKGAAYLSFLQA